jgi:hypothetical protein
MVRTRALVAALVMSLVVPAAAFAQQGGMGRGQGGQGMGGQGGIMAARNLVEQGNVEFLLGKATDLKLTEEQKAALKVVADKWTAETKEARDQVRPLMPQQGQGMGGMGGGDMQAMRARLEQMMPLMQNLVETDQKAMEEAMKHLDDSQKAASRTLVQERNRPRRPGTL